MKQRQAMHYTMDGDTARCFLCPHKCVLKPGQTGICRVRKNIGGTLYSLNYAHIAAYNIDPIEKKPLYHFYPGSRILSVGSYGCNLKCSFCQNHAIAHGNPGSTVIGPQDLVERAQEADGSIGIAYTYNEPSVWYEYVFDTACIAKERGLKNVLVTNGYIDEAALRQLLPLIDAVNIDIKAFNGSYYKKVCSGTLLPVLEAVRLAAGYCHVEVTTLIVEGLNSNPNELDRLGEWVSGVDKRIPLHLSRYFPAYLMDSPPTRLDTMTAAREVMKKHLDYVYIGNVAGVDNNTYCPGCGAKLVERNGYGGIALIENKKCEKCGESINLILKMKEK